MDAPSEQALEVLLSSLRSRELRDALDHIPMGHIPELNAQLAQAGEALAAGDPGPMRQLIGGVVLRARLEWNDSYRHAVKEMEDLPESEWPREPVDHRKLFAELRASA